jgi:tripartite-type tricarboxylate transporter receptor subunit TctC
MEAPGLGTIHHVMGEMLKLAAGINIVHVPFQGGAPALTAATGGHIQVFFGNATDIGSAVKSGIMRVIVVTSAERSDVLPDVPTMRERSDVLPDVPTMRESGYPELEGTNWSGLVAPRVKRVCGPSELDGQAFQAARN